MLGGIQRFLNSVIDVLRRCTDPILVLCFYVLSTGASETDPEQQSSPPNISGRGTRHRFLAKAMRGELFTPVPQTSLRYPHRPPSAQNVQPPLSPNLKRIQQEQAANPTPSLKGYTIKSWPNGKNPSYPTGGDELEILHRDAIAILDEHASLLGLPYWQHAYPACPYRTGGDPVG